MTVADPPPHPSSFDLRVARTPWQRMRGLLGQPALQAHQGLLIQPCNMIHTVGMRYAIDVVFVDRAWHVVQVAAQVSPRRMRHCLRAWAALELAGGQAAAWGVQAGLPLPAALRPTPGRQAPGSSASATARTGARS